MKPGQVITFYSYKGGVGRTMALANIAVLLARAKERVLVIDWDLEAPGLDKYFEIHAGPQLDDHRGFINALLESKLNARLDWRPVTCDIQGSDWRLDAIFSGGGQDDYSTKVAEFSWERYFENANGGKILEDFRNEIKEEYDFVLIDSRTGVTDSGGVCTIFLPDILILNFTANEQSLSGCRTIAEKVHEGRQKMIYFRQRPMIIPVVNRWAGRDETDLAEEWFVRIMDQMGHFLDSWVPKRVDKRTVLERFCVPHVAKFSFGECLPVVGHSLSNTELPGYFYSQIAEVLLACDELDDYWERKAPRQNLYQVPDPSAHFVGRSAELADLHSWLSDRDSNCLLLLGLAEVGKTQLVIRFCEIQRDQRRAIVYITANSTGEIKSRLATIDRVDGSYESAVAWLEENDNWLIVFDHLAEACIPVVTQLVRDLPRGNFIVVSRHAISNDSWYEVQLDVLDGGSAAQLVRQCGIEEAAVSSVTEEIGRLPGLLMAFSRESRRTGNRNAGELLEGLPTKLRFRDALHQVMTAFDSDTQTLFKLLCVCRNHPVPTVLLPHLLAVACANDTSIEQLIRSTLVAESAKRRVVVPRVVYRTVLASLHQSDIDELENQIISAISRLFSADNAKTRSSARVYDELDALVSFIFDKTRRDNATNFIELLSVLKTYGDRLAAFEQWSVAEESYRKCMRTISMKKVDSYTSEEQNRVNDVVASIEPAILLALARVLVQQNKLVEAAEACDMVCEPEGVDVQRLAKELGLGTAIPFDLEQCGQLPFESVARSDNSNLSEAIQILSKIHGRQGQFESAIALSKLAVDFDAQQSGNRGRSLESLNQLTCSYLLAGYFEEAERCARSTIDLASSDRNRPGYIEALANLASVCQAIGNYDEARRLYSLVLEEQRATLGDSDPVVATSLGNLALLERDCGNLEAAIDLADRAIQIDEATFGTHHPAVAIDRNNLAQILQDSGDLSNAEIQMNTALEIDRSVFADCHPAVIRDKNNLAQLNWEQGKLDEARAAFEELLDVVKDDSSLALYHKDISDNYVALCDHIGGASGDDALVVPAANITGLVNRDTFNQSGGAMKEKRMKMVFISYSRRNRYIAQRLGLDLQRSGCQPWFDHNDIMMSEEWERSIEDSIRKCEYFLYLWSPEANVSEHVQKEYRIAQEHLASERIGIVRVAGESAEMPDGLRKIQHAELTEDYWKGLSPLFKWLETDEPAVRSARDLKNSGITMSEARDTLKDEDSAEWNVWNEQEESWTTFVRIPLAPSGYATSWLVAEKSKEFKVQEEPQVVLKFTGDRAGRDTVDHVLQYLLANNVQPQIFYIEGPQQNRRYELRNDQPHEWKDCIDLAGAVISNWCGNKLVHYFFDSPQALIFPIAASFPVRRSYCVYTLNENSEDKNLYSCVFSN